MASGPQQRMGWGVDSAKMQAGKEGSLRAKTPKHQLPRGSAANCVGSEKVFGNLDPFSDESVLPAKAYSFSIGQRAAVSTNGPLTFIRTGKLPGTRGQGEGTTRKEATPSLSLIHI